MKKAIEMVDGLGSVRDASGLADIRHAVGVLRDAQLPLTSRLEQGAELIWSATFFKEEWPLALQRRIDDIFVRMLRHGSIKTTVPKLSHAEADGMIAILLMWAAELEHAFSGEATLII